jgi:hypothetical protein
MNELVISGLVLGAAAASFLVWRGLRSSRRAQLRRIAHSLGLERVADRAVLEDAGPLRRKPFEGPDTQLVTAWRGSLLEAQLWAIELARGRAPADPVVLLRDGSDPLPPFELLPRGNAGPTGLQFHGHERFGELFALHCEDEEAVRRVFRDEVVGFFERAENLSWLLVADGDWLAITVTPLGERRRRLDPKHLAGFVEDAKVLYRVLRGAPPRPRIGRDRSAAPSAPSAQS